MRHVLFHRSRLRSVLLVFHGTAVLKRLLVVGGAYNVYFPTYTAEYYLPLESARRPVRSALCPLEETRRLHDRKAHMEAVYHAVWVRLASRKRMWRVRSTHTNRVPVC